MTAVHSYSFATLDDRCVPWLLITSGRGPRECQRFAHLILGEIQRESEQRNLSCELWRATEGDGPQCIQSALIGIDGPEAESFVAGLEGTHKWVCPSPFRPNHGRKNEAVRVYRQEERRDKAESARLRAATRRLTTLP